MYLTNTLRKNDGTPLLYISSPPLNPYVDLQSLANIGSFSQSRAAKRLRKVCEGKKVSQVFRSLLLAASADISTLTDLHRG